MIVQWTTCFHHRIKEFLDLSCQPSAIHVVTHYRGTAPDK